MTELWCRKVFIQDRYTFEHRAVLAPRDRLSEETLAKLPEGVNLRVQASQPRNGAYHRYYWALVNKVWENLPDEYPMSPETLHDVIKMGAGCTRVVRLPNNVLYELPGSIAFGSMDETAFREFMDRAIKYIVSDLIPGMDSEALENEVLDMMR